MNFLDIDLDFFLDDIAHHAPRDRRLPVAAYPVWKAERVREFLEVRCGLSKKNRIPGRFVREHDSAFDYWRDLRCMLPDEFPIIVTHVDAHADLGMGDASWLHIMTDVLHQPVGDRENAKRGVHYLSAGSYLAYAIACRWVSTVEYVRPTNGGKDLAPFLFQNLDERTGIIEMRAYTKQDYESCGIGANIAGSLRAIAPATIEPPVAFRSIDYRKWKATAPFDRALLCQSPAYTPKAADNLIKIFYDYIEFC